MTLPVSWVAFLMSSSEASPFLGFLALMGKRMSLAWYSFRRCELSCSDSSDLLRLRWSTAMPMVRA
jgi:hypothetical protein